MPNQSHLLNINTIRTMASVQCGSHDHWVAACEFQPSVQPHCKQMAKRILATDQGDTDEEDLDSDGWQSDYEAMMQALGD